MPKKDRQASPEQQALARKLRKARADDGRSQLEIATAAGLHATTLSAIERGKRSPDTASIKRLAAVYGRPASDFIDAKETATAIAQAGTPDEYARATVEAVRKAIIDLFVDIIHSLETALTRRENPPSQTGTAASDTNG